MVLIYYTFLAILVLVYLLSIFLYIYYWQKTPLWNIPSSFLPKTTISIVVAARNETENIDNCLEAILAQNYPKELVQILLIDDHSEDNTAAIIQSFENVVYSKLPDNKTGKKSAIEHGISLATGQLIVTTDADCFMDKQWLQYIASIYQAQKPKLIAAPVSFFEPKTIFEKFQTLDFMGMMAVSAAGIKGGFMNMCNGANLAYEKEAFFAVNGFEGIDHLASGDDMLLMEKIAAKYPNQITYLKNPAAQTWTKAKPTISSFLQQRIRWATKSGNYQKWQTQLLLAAVWLLCWFMLINLVLGLCYQRHFLYLFLITFLLKGIADYLFLSRMATFFERPKLMTAFLPSLLWHWWYILVVGSLGIFKKEYQWKGRKVK